MLNSFFSQGTILNNTLVQHMRPAKVQKAIEDLLTVLF